MAHCVASFKDPEIFNVVEPPLQTGFTEAVTVGTVGFVQLGASNKRKLSIAHSSEVPFELALNIKSNVVPVPTILKLNSVKLAEFKSVTPSPTESPVVSNDK